MKYKTFDPNKNLADLIKCYWTLEAEKETNPEKQRIVPDGCMEMIFHYGDLYKQYLADGTSIIQPKYFVFGQVTQPLDIDPTGTTCIFSVRFHPNGFLPFTTIPLKEMENTAISLEKLFGKDGLKIEKKMLNAKSTLERVKQFEIFLLSRLPNVETVDRIVKSIVETILTANGQLSVNKLSEQTTINRRQLERKFASTIGLSPKQLSKTIRLQATLKMLLTKKITSLTALAYDNEYYDQAHFLKDFKEFTGYSPKEFYGDSLKMSALFYGTD